MFEIQDPVIHVYFKRVSVCGNKIHGLNERKLKSVRGLNPRSCIK